MSKGGGSVKAITIGAIIGFLPSVGVAWAFAVTAAEHVITPHVETSKVRIRVMCTWAKVQDSNTRAICEKVGANCRSPQDSEILLAECNQDP